MFYNNDFFTWLSFKVGRTPLHWAVAAKRRDVVDFLINNGADVNALDDVGI